MQLFENGVIKYVLDEGILLQYDYTEKDIAAGLPLTALIERTKATGVDLMPLAMND